MNFSLLSSITHQDNNMDNLKKSRELKYQQLYRERKWAEARIPLEESLRDEPDDHWLLFNIGETYFEERNFEKALEYEERALKIEPRCPKALFDSAEALYELYRPEETIKICKNLIHRGVNRIAYGECGEGLKSARMNVNDCRYLMGLGYADLDNFTLAARYIKSHLANRSRKVVSVYFLYRVKKNLALVLESKDTWGI
jgi:tetratricopeptide (TPR) repeat protein